jgi:DHA1 family inner membrane transport protein
MTVGNAAGGWLVDRDPRRSVVVGSVGVILTAVLFGLVAHLPAGLFVAAFLLGAASLFLGPALQARLIAAAPYAQLMGAAVNQSATNVANSLGAALGSIAIAGGLGYLAPSRVGAGLGVLGLGLALLGYVADRRFAARPAAGSAVPVTGGR